MQFREFMLTQHARMHAHDVAGGRPSYQDRMMGGVDETLFRTRPGKRLNSLSWILWHITRIEDVAMHAVLAASGQVLDDNTIRAGLGVEQTALGTLMGDDEVEQLSAGLSLDGMIAYRAAVGRATQRLLTGLDLAVLDESIRETDLALARSQNAFTGGSEVVAERWLGLPKAYLIQHAVLFHSAMHFGQGDVTRNLLGLESL